MWYSSVKIGIVEIDMDHCNIDTMLRLYSSGQVPAGYLPQIINGLIKHFAHEEEIIAGLGREFPEDHKQEHLRLAKLLEEKMAKWKANEVTDKEFAEELRAMLLLHVTKFDVLLEAPI